MYKVNGKSVRSPSSDVSIPASLSTLVTGVIGLDDSAMFVQPDIIKDAPPAPGFRNAPPLSDYWAQYVSPYAYPAGFTDVSNPSTSSWSVKGYTPDQIKGACDVPSTYDGAGQTVAVIDAYASPTILQDVNQWSINRGLPTMSHSQLVQVVPPGVYRRPENPRLDPQGWYGEETLDIEAVHGMAPAAKIVFVGAPNNYQDLDAAMNHVVDRQLAQIVTNSYVCTRKGWIYGSGGGVSQLFAEPWYQSGLGLSGRAQPDVAALGDPQTGFLVGQTQTFPDGAYYDEYRIGGTRLSGPIFAGLMALLDQKAGSPHGFANPLFYANSGAFYDVTSVKTAVTRRNFNNNVDASNGTSDFLPCPPRSVPELAY
jgi:subtilase family serine protease